MRSPLADLPARIAVTGSAGYLGSATVAALCNKPEVELVAGIDIAPTEPRPRQTRRLISITHDIRTSLLDMSCGTSISRPWSTSHFCCVPPGTSPLPPISISTLLAVYSKTVRLPEWANLST